ncbi:aldo/keto reductase [Spartinivicinus ruber]|uniref:aldo/keto reductase n=1 Tax=Spartinivicinus ruber TaxID=2683272 RepID=UPI0013D22002|nr:aldo/keto reductase [Spartinivicinus ruber]
MNNSELLLKNKLADTNISVSAIGLGTVKLGRNQGVKYPTTFKIPSDQEAKQLLQHAKNLGINLIDTAPAYGNSEERLGPLLKGQRHDWVICTKTGEEFIDGQSSFNFTPEHTIKSIERSLQRLNTDYLDIVLVHSDGNDLAIIEQYGTLEVLSDLKKQGKIKAIGMSTKTVEGGLAALKQADAVMATHNLSYSGEIEVLDYAAGHNKAIFIKKALASGHICSETYDDPVQASMDFIFAHSGVTSIILGTINPEHMSHNVKCAQHALLRSRNE